MRILHLARYGSVRGGAETYIATIAQGLRDAGHEVGLGYGMEPDDARPEVRDGLHLPLLIEPATEPHPGEEGSLREAIEGWKPDLVHVHTPDISWVAPLAATLAPVLLAVHDHRVDCPVGTRYWAAWKRACAITPGPWCLAYNVAAHCGSLRANVTLRPYRSWQRAREGASALPVQVFSNFMRAQVLIAGIEPGRVTATPYPVPPLVDAADPPAGDVRPVVLASGRLNKEKGFHQLIDALEHVRAPVHLVIVGEGHERAALERRASGAPGPHRITFTGWLSARALAGWVERAGIVCMPSMWPEPFGIAGLEAMARARPVVAFDSGGIGEWLTDGVNGRLVPAGNVRGLGEAIGSLVADPDASREMGAAGKARADAEFSLASHVERLIHLYEDVRAGHTA